MSKILFPIVGGIIGFILTVGIFFLAGHFFGPLYQGEDEAARNVKVFLGVALCFIAVGFFIGHRLSNKKT
ncbi:hypothetical protein FLM48_04875 [Shewanella sp. Scap07]|uniref:hypothetical protein n=1 Tax=Shewanella sp. Scap07 TaxID=2589987 RepID=UPI0015C14ACD|nr:hypothetical protein [Shewanella sp. Scap07]QLE84480.1 hypothetical protein FLM48_04875 [Shewanella sp. Scap07]